MAVFKRVLCKERLRRVPPQFSWIDHRLVRDRHISRCSTDALALYLFLVTVADGQGLSYYADATVCRLLPLDAEALSRARRELIDNRLIAYRRPLYQVLALGPPQPSPQARSSQQMQSSPRRPAPARPQPGGSVDVQSTGPVPHVLSGVEGPAPSNVQGSNVQGPQSFSQIFQLMALDSAQDKPLDSTSNRKKP